MHDKKALRGSRWLRLFDPAEAQKRSSNCMPAGLLSGKVIVVTGGGSGIGRECALAMARESAHVVVADIDAKAAAETVAELATPGLAVTCDVAVGENVREAVEAAISHFGKLDGVHNNAGISSPQSLLTRPPKRNGTGCSR